MLRDLEKLSVVKAEREFPSLVRGNIFKTLEEVMALPTVLP